MSYRTYINGHEWLGNNIMHPEIFHELERQGCVFDDDYVAENFEIKELDPLVKACEEVIKRMFADNNEIADFSQLISTHRTNPGYLTAALQDVAKQAYINISVSLLNYIGEENYTIEWYSDKENPPEFGFKFNLKPGVKVIFEAY